MAVAGSVVLVADQLTKSWAVAHLGDGHADDLVGSLRLRLTSNSGSAFSLGSGRNLGPLIALLALVVVGALVAHGQTTRTRLGAVAVGMVAGGALGNVADRAFRAGDGFLGGHVIDFVDLQWWPVFNVADAAIVGGALGLVALGLRRPSPPPGEPSR